MLVQGLSAQVTRDTAMQILDEVRKSVRQTRKNTKVDLYETKSAPFFWIVDWFAIEIAAETQDSIGSARPTETHLLEPINVVPAEFPNNPTCVFARLDLSTGSEAPVMDLLEKMMANTRKEPGNFYYNLYRSTLDGSLWMFEAYGDQAALETHRQSSYYQTNVPQIVKHLANPIKVHTLV